MSIIAALLPLVIAAAIGVMLWRAVSLLFV